MENIIKDRLLEQTIRFIQEHINKNCLSQDAGEQFVSAYNNLSRENAAQTFQSLSIIYQSAQKKTQRDFEISCFNFAALVFLTGGVISLGSFISLRAILWTKEHRYIDLGIGTGCFGICLMSIGLITFLSIGH
jgi:hypothetical protein